jgi:outer membrane protein
MKRSVAFVLTLASGFVLHAAAQTPSAPAAATATPAGPTKIAIIAFQPAVAKTNEGQKAFADLQKKYAPKQAQLKALSDEVDNLTKQLQTQSATLSEADRAARAKTIDDKKKQLERSAEDAQNDFQNEMQELYGSLAQKVYDVLNDYAKQHGYTVVLDIAQQQARSSMRLNPPTLPRPLSTHTMQNPASLRLQLPRQPLCPRHPLPQAPNRQPSNCGTLTEGPQFFGAFSLDRADSARASPLESKFFGLLNCLWKKLWILRFAIPTHRLVFPLANQIHL